MTVASSIWIKTHTSSRIHSLDLEPGHDSLDLFDRKSCCSNRGFINLMVINSIYSLIQDAGDEEVLDIRCIDVQLPRNEGNVDPGVGFNQLDQNLSPNVLQKIFYMFFDERVIHYALRVLFQDLLEFIDVIILVGGDQISHGQNVRIILVRLGFLSIKRVDS